MLFPKQVLAIAKVAAKEKTKSVLNGVLIRCRESEVRFVATDGRRFVEVVVQRARFDPEDFPEVDGLDLTPRPGFEVLIHAAKFESLRHLPASKAIKPILEEIAMVEALHEGKETVRFAGTDLESTNVQDVRKFDGAFPDYDEVVPATHEGRLNIGVNAKYLRDALDQLVACTGDPEARVVLSFGSPSEADVKRGQWNDGGPILLSAVASEHGFVPAGKPDVEARTAVMPLRND